MVDIKAKWRKQQKRDYVARCITQNKLIEKDITVI